MIAKRASLGLLLALTICLTTCLLTPPCFADQSEVNAIASRLDAAFRQTFDGQTLRRWQETYQSACLEDIPRLARLLQDDGVDLPFDPFARHLGLLKQTLPQMQDKQVQAMDLHVQISTRWMAAPPRSSQASDLQAQMTAQEKTVKLYDSIVGTLRERVKYLDKCTRFAEKSFADAARERQAKPQPRPVVKPSVRVQETGDTIAMPVGTAPEIVYDPKKGLSIGQVAELGPPVPVENLPPSVTATSNVGSRPSSADVDSAIQRAAQQCKDAYERAYERILRNRRSTIDEAKKEIPRLEACVAEKTAELAKWKKQRQEVAPTGNQDLLELLRKERDDWQKKAEKMEDQAAKNDAARKWGIYQQEVERVETEIRRLRLIDETIVETQKQLADCEVRLQLMRDKIANAEKALDDSFQRAVAAHRAKRFAEIDRLIASRNLTALQRCAAQGSVGLDDIMRELFQ